ncbi:MAG: sigma-54 dependent transcriptional regulator [Desulfuromonadaceae bacterium]|nr:sigma-54 dependent transcriptional regulator [Desulfuromonadaceae bacterium]
MHTPATILAVDDQASSRSSLEQQLRSAGFVPLMAADAIEAMAVIERQPVDLILSDLILPTVSGKTFLEQVHESYPEIPFIVLTAHSSITNAVQAIRCGAFDYVEKQCDPEELRFTLRRALEYQRLRNENDSIKDHLREKFSFQSFITTSDKMRKTLELAARVAESPRTTVTIYGESGCGKEVLSRAIHSATGGLPTEFVAVNCAAIPDALLESELFGHVRGAFTGADREREGKFSVARGGTILLDEIGDMPLALQAKLLRVLEERVFEKVGSNTPVQVECRVIVATNCNLGELVKAGNFRNDLYHRINVFPITLPPLRDRREDIPFLTEHFLNLMRNHQGKKLLGFSQKAMEVLMAYDWPGNVRELRNCLERAAIVTDSELIMPEHLSIYQADGGKPHSDIVTSTVGHISYSLDFCVGDVSLEAITNQVLDITLERCGGNKSKAAELLKVNRKMFYRS